MGLRGETVGTAYVRILADGKDFDRSVERQLGESEGGFQTAGGDHAKAYREGFDEEIERVPPLRRVQVALLRRRGEIDAAGHLAGSKWMDGFEASLKRNFKDKIGERLAEEFRDILRRGGDIDAIDNFIDNLGAHVHRVTTQISQDEDRARRSAEEFEESFRRNMETIDRDTERILAGVTREVDKWNTSFRKAGDNINRFGLNASQDIDAFQRKLVQTNRTIAKTGRDSDKSLSRLTHTLFGFSDAAGTAFGRGSRNNFLNFFGSVVRNLSRLPGYLSAAVGGMTDFVSTLGRGSGEALSFGERLGQFGKLIGSGTAGLVAFGIAVGIVVTVIGPLASLISGLAGAVVALAGSLAFAAAAGFGVLLGSILPVVAAVGGLVLAFTGLSDTMKKDLKSAYEPVVEVFQKMSDIAASNIFGPIEKAAPVIAETLRLMVPLVDKVTAALGRWPGMFTKILQSPAFIKFNRQMGEFLPDAVDDLGRIFANVFKGMLGLFRAVLPITGDFLDWLVDMTGRFRDFTNSTAGQNTLKDFFSNAADSAKSVIGFVDSLADAIGKLFSAGRESGDTIFDDLTNQIRSFIEYLNNNPGAVKGFFRDSVETIRSIGRTLGGLIKLFDDLDTPENRKSIQSFFNGVGKAAEAMGKAFKVVDKIVDAFRFTMLGSMIVVGIKVIKVIGNIIDWFRSLGGVWDDITNHFHQSIDRIRGFFSGLGDLVGKVIDGIKSGWNKLPGFIRDLVPLLFKAGGALIAALVRGITGPVVDVTSIAVKIGDAIMDALGDVINWIIDRLNDAIPNSISVKLGPDIPLPDNPIPHLARGGILRDPRFIVAGEDGPEAVVPLKRPLSQVDPAVRALSAIAQGLAVPGGSGKTIEVGGIQIITPTEDPRAVAAETIDQLAATGYF